MNNQIKMYKVVVLSVLLAFSSASPRRGFPSLERLNNNNGLPKVNERSSGRINIGESVVIEGYPYQLSLSYYMYHICGASLISSKFAITAARCTASTGGENLAVRAGSTYYHMDGIVVKVAKVYTHPNYDPVLIDYDISILELEEELQFSKDIRPIYLPSKGQEFEDESRGEITGWGSKRSGSQILNPQLQKGTVRTMSLEKCIEIFGKHRITERMICSTLEQGDVCFGDTGGPLVIHGFLAGVVSWGLGCGSYDDPSVYAGVVALRSFIEEITGL